MSLGYAPIDLNETNNNKNKSIKKIRSPIILIGSKKLLEDQINFYN